MHIHPKIAFSFYIFPFVSAIFQNIILEHNFMEMVILKCVFSNFVEYPAILALEVMKGQTLLPNLL